MLVKSASICDLNVAQNGWLYMFQTKEGCSSIWDTFKVKIGKTSGKLQDRIKQYKNYNSFINILAFHCENVDERERLMKAFFKHKLNWKPVDGLEYFDQPYELILQYLQKFSELPQTDIIQVCKLYVDKQNIDFFYEKITNLYNHKFDIDNEYDKQNLSTTYQHLIKQLAPIGINLATKLFQDFFNRCNDHKILLYSTDVVAVQMVNNEFRNIIASIDKFSSKIVYVNENDRKNYIIDVNSTTFLLNLKEGIKDCEKELNVFYATITNLLVQEENSTSEYRNKCMQTLSVIHKFKNLHKYIDFQSDLGTKLAQNAVELSNIHLLPKTVIQIENQKINDLLDQISNVLQYQISFNAPIWMIFDDRTIGSLVAQKIKQNGFKFKSILLPFITINEIIVQFEHVFDLVEIAFKNIFSSLLDNFKFFPNLVAEHINNSLSLCDDNDNANYSLYRNMFCNYHCLIAWIQWLQNNTATSPHCELYHENIKAAFVEEISKL
jgi:hypothetical protein